MTLRDRFLILIFTNRINLYVRSMEAPMRVAVSELTKADHDRQRDRVRASEARSVDTTEAHATYMVRAAGGWRHGKTVPPRPVQPEARP